MLWTASPFNSYRQQASLALPLSLQVVSTTRPNPLFLGNCEPTSCAYLKRTFPGAQGEAMLNWLGRTRVLGAVFCDFALMWKFRCCSVSQSCMTLRPPWTVAPQDPLSSTFSQSLLKHTFIESIMLPDRLILCSALFLLPSIFPSIRVFSNEYSGLMIDWFDLQTPKSEILCGIVGISTD